MSLGRPLRVCRHACADIHAFGISSSLQQNCVEIKSWRPRFVVRNFYYSDKYKYQRLLVLVRISFSCGKSYFLMHPLHSIYTYLSERDCYLQVIAANHTIEITRALRQYRACVEENLQGQKSVSLKMSPSSIVLLHPCLAFYGITILIPQLF